MSADTRDMRPLDWAIAWVAGPLLSALLWLFFLFAEFQDEDPWKNRWLVGLAVLPALCGVAWCMTRQRSGWLLLFLAVVATPITAGLWFAATMVWLFIGIWQSGCTQDCL